MPYKWTKIWSLYLLLVLCESFVRKKKKKSLPNLHGTVKYAKDGSGLRQHSQVLSYKWGTLPQSLLICSFVDLKYIEKLANEAKVKNIGNRPEKQRMRERRKTGRKGGRNCRVQLIKRCRASLLISPDHLLSVQPEHSNPLEIIHWLWGKTAFG